MVRLLQDYLRLSAERSAEAVACVLRDQSLSYGELEDLSNRLAAKLVRQGVKRGDFVCIVKEKSLEALLSMLAVLKAGAAYVPVDPEMPEARKQMIFEDCEPSLIVGEGGLDFCWKDLAVEEFAEVLPEVDSGDLAHIIYTSGSTGKPKGVMATHANLIDFVEWAAEHYGLAAADVIAQFSPLHFDLFVFDIYCALKVGAKMVLVEDRFKRVPVDLIKLLNEQAVTVWLTVPTQMKFMVQMKSIVRDFLPSLKQLLFCGEVLPVKYLRAWMEALPAVTFYNVYGPTETVAFCTSYQVDSGDDLKDGIPIGQARENLRSVVLDDNLNLISRGAKGELCFWGIGVSLGYLKRPQATEANFVNHDLAGEVKLYRTGDLVAEMENGDYLFHGRRDRQVKYRGHRIELGEIEAALYRIEGVAEAVVLPVRDENGVVEVLKALVVKDGANQLALPELLADQIPHYMVPRQFVYCDNFPKTPSGKIDRVQLQEEYSRSRQKKESLVKSFLVPLIASALVVLFISVILITKFGDYTPTLRQLRAYYESPKVENEVLFVGSSVTKRIFDQAAKPEGEHCLNDYNLSDGTTNGDRIAARLMELDLIKARDADTIIVEASAHLNLGFKPHVYQYYLSRNYSLEEIENYKEYLDDDLFEYLDGISELERYWNRRKYVWNNIYRYGYEFPVMRPLLNYFNYKSEAMIAIHQSLLLRDDFFAYDEASVPEQIANKIAGLNKLIVELDQTDSKVIVVVIPPSLQVLEAVNSQGQLYDYFVENLVRVDVDLSEQMPDTYFSDATHPNPEGSELVIARICEQIANP